MKFIIYASYLTFMSCAAYAQEQDIAKIGRVDVSGLPMGAPLEPTTVILQETDKLGAVAEVIYTNIDINGPDDTGMYPLSINAIDVDIYFEYTEQADSIVVHVPPGYYADPPYLVLPEGVTGPTIYIYREEFVGS